MLQFPQDVGSLTACSIFGVIGGIVLCLYGWPLSFSTTEKKGLPPDDERPAPRFELAFSVLNNHTIVGFCLSFEVFAVIFASSFGHSDFSSRILVTVVCSLAWGVLMYWQYDFLGSLGIIGLSGCVLGPLIVALDYGSGLHFLITERLRVMVTVFVVLYVVLLLMRHSIRKFSLWLASAFLGSFVVVDSIVALVALGKYHFNAAEMNNAFMNDPVSDFVPFGILEYVVEQSGLVLHHRRPVQLLGEVVGWVLLCLVGLAHQLCYVNKWLWYKPRASRHRDRSRSGDAAHMQRKKNITIVATSSDLTTANHSVEVLEKVVLSYRVLLILSFITTMVWLGFLIGRFKPVAAPSEKPQLNATVGAPWHATLFFILFVIAEIIGVPMAFFSALNMWKPVERDSRLFKDCLGVPRNKPWKWPLIDVFICHYNEDCTQTMMTLQHCMDMDWPKDRMHIYILDDGYFRKPTGPYKEKVDVPDFDSLSELDKQRVLWWDDPYHYKIENDRMVRIDEPKRAPRPWRGETMVPVMKTVPSHAGSLNSPDRPSSSLPMSPTYDEDEIARRFTGSAHSSRPPSRRSGRGDTSDDVRSQSSRRRRPAAAPANGQCSSDDSDGGDERRSKSRRSRRRPTSRGVRSQREPKTAAVSTSPHDDDVQQPLLGSHVNPVRTEARGVAWGPSPPLSGSSVTRNKTSPHCTELVDLMIKKLGVGIPGINTDPERRDCALGTHRCDFLPPKDKEQTQCKVTFLGRLKPDKHHAKAGNINNALYNEGLVGHYVATFDNDMEPHPLFLQACMTYFFPPTIPEDAQANWYWKMEDWGDFKQPRPLNAVAFVQTPQYFKTDRDPVTGRFNREVKGMEGGDPAGHGNKTFFDAHQHGRDGYNLSMFAGTNAVFRRTAFDAVAGIAYGTQTEDAQTGDGMHMLGFDSVYARKDKPWQEDPRMRQAKLEELAREVMEQRLRARSEERHDENRPDDHDVPALIDIRPSGTPLPSRRNRQYAPSMTGNDTMNEDSGDDGECKDDDDVHASVSLQSPSDALRRRNGESMVAAPSGAGQNFGGVVWPLQPRRPRVGTRKRHAYDPDAVKFDKPIELATGLVPETNATSFGQRLRWAKGAFQILMVKLGIIDPIEHADKPWLNNHPRYGRESAYITEIKKQVRSLKVEGDVAPQHFRKVFVASSTTYPLGGLCALFYIAVACYFMYSGVPPISTPGMSLVYVFIPYYACKWGLQWLGNWLVRNPLDVWRSQQTWFSYGIIMCFAMYGAITEKITGKAGAWLSGGSRDGGLKMSPLEYPNIVFFVFLSVGIVVSLIRFLEYGSISAPWDMWAALGFGGFITVSMWPMVRKSLYERLGVDPYTNAFRADVLIAASTLALVVICVVWQHMVTVKGVPND